jgi:hypothetical protein
MFEINDSVASRIATPTTDTIGAAVRINSTPKAKTAAKSSTAAPAGLRTIGLRGAANASASTDSTDSSGSATIMSDSSPTIIRPLATRSSQRNGTASQPAQDFPFS